MGIDWEDDICRCLSLDNEQAVVDMNDMVEDHSGDEEALAIDE